MDAGKRWDNATGAKCCGVKGRSELQLSVEIPVAPQFVDDHGQRAPPFITCVEGLRDVREGARLIDRFQQFARDVNAVTKEDLVRVAKKYIDLDHLNIIIVGDRAVIEDPLRRTAIAPIVILDADAKPVVRVQP